MPVRPFIYSAPALTAWFWASLGAWICLEIWVWTRELGATAGDNRDRGSRVWIVAWFWGGFYVGFALPHFAPGGDIRHGALAWFGVGVALIWLGVGLRWWAVHTLGRFFRTSVIIQGSHRMITTGPYGVVRNPSYSGALLSAAGVGLALNNWYSFIALAVATLIAYARRIRVEQRALTEHFGQPYREYVRHTWALIPFVW